MMSKSTKFLKFLIQRPSAISKFFLAVFIAVITSFININAQSQIKFETVINPKFESNNYISSIIKDQRGYLWFGSFTGLVRYDGNNFKIFKHIQGDSTSISNNRVWALFEDKEGVIWIGLDNEIGLNSYDYKTEKFQAYPIDKKLPENILQNTCFEINQTNDGRVWFGGWNGIRILDKKSNTFTYHIKDVNKPNALYSGSAFDIVEDKLGRVWVFTFGNIAHIYRKETNDFERVQINLDGDYWKKVIKDNDGNFYITCYQGGITKFDPIKKAIVEKFSAQQSGSQNFVTGFNAEDGNIWFGSDGNGISIYNTAENRFLSIIKNANSQTSVSDNVIKKLYKDNNNIVWVGTWNNGLNIYDPSKYKFGICENITDKNQTFSSNPVTAIYQGADGIIWIGTDGDGLWQYDDKVNSFTNISKKLKNPLMLERIRSICQDNHGNLLLGTPTSGMTLLNPKTHQQKYFMDGKCINAIIKTKSGHIFVGSNINNNWALQEFNDKKQSFVNRNAIENLDRNVHGLYEDSRGILWVSTGGRGVYEFDYKNNRATSYSFNAMNQSGPSSNDVTAILEDRYHTIWVGTEGCGLDSYNLTTKKWNHYSEADGLQSNIISGLLEDENGFLWISSDKGLSKFNSTDKIFLNFDRDDGLQKGTFFRNSRLKSKDGVFFFGGSAGLNAFRPQSVKLSNYSPNVYITNLFISNSEIKVNNGSKILTKPINITDTITLSYKHAMFSIEYNAMVFSNQKRVRYAYKLEGFNDDWVDAGNERKAVFTNIDPGVYIFKVKATNSDGLWGKSEAAITIVITPPWWATKIALASFLLLFICSFLAIYFYRVRRLQGQKELLEIVVKERTTELALTNEIVTEVNLLLKERQTEIEQKSIKLAEQAKKLLQSNVELEERQHLIEAQSAELIAQKDQLKLKNEFLDELVATKDKLFSIVGHDLKSPFFSILSYCEILIMDFRNSTDDVIEQRLCTMRDAAKDTLTLLNNLLEWSTSQQGLINLKFKEYKFSALLDGELSLLSQQANRKDVTIHKSVEGEEFLVEADANVISTVVRNLVSNALKFSNKGSSIHITLDYMDVNSLTFSVRDEGVGMDSEKLKTLFKANTNVSTFGTSGEKGTGLGLLLCADFIKLHNGKIWVESQENVGSTFFFRIPTIQPDSNC